MKTQSALVANNDQFLRDLQLFCIVARRSSFIAAATETGISPAHVSKRIAMLETSLGVKLFMRTTRRVSITSDGEAAFQWAQKILDDVQGMADAFAGLDDPRGLLRIGTSLRLGREHVSPALTLLRRRHPGLEIWLELLDRRVDLVGENFDIDIRVGEVLEPHLIAHKIVESFRVLAAAPAYLERRGAPKTLAELAHHDCLLFRGRDQRFGVWRLAGPERRGKRESDGADRIEPQRHRAAMGRGRLRHRDVLDLGRRRQPAERQARARLARLSAARGRVGGDVGAFVAFREDPRVHRLSQAAIDERPLRARDIRRRRVLTLLCSAHGR